MNNTIERILEKYEAYANTCDATHLTRAHSKRLAATNPDKVYDQVRLLVTDNIRLLCAVRFLWSEFDDMLKGKSWCSGQPPMELVGWISAVETGLEELLKSELFVPKETP